VKYWLRPDLENRIKAGEIQARLGSQVVEITERDVLVRGALGNEERIPADRVYPLIGFQPDFELFKRIGIKFDTATGRPEINAETLETTVPGVHVAGSVSAGLRISEVFIENGRFDGEKIFGSPTERQQAQALYQGIRRETGE
jgi:thioredoxin reductase (NADPH)